MRVDITSGPEDVETIPNRPGSENSRKITSSRIKFEGSKRSEVTNVGLGPSVGGK